MTNLDSVRIVHLESLSDRTRVEFSDDTQIEFVGVGNDTKYRYFDRGVEVKMDSSNASLPDEVRGKVLLIKRSVLDSTLPSSSHQSR